MAGYYEGDFYPVCSNGNNGFGSNGWGDLAALIVVAGLFGWGNGGFGGFGGGNRGGACATQADLSAGFANSEIMSDLNSIINTLTQGFAGINTAVANATSTLGFNMAQGFHGVDNAVCTLGYQTQAGFNTLANQIASCCCDLKTMNLENRYLNERQTCDIVAAINAGNQRLVDIYTTDKLASKDARIAALEAQISNAEQSAYLLNELKPCPKASYLVQPPQPVTFPTNCCGNVAYAGYGACGASVQ